MKEQLISKKDLLTECGITYGQLYRWKRKHLIPDEWFIRKSTFTGQETFLPKAKVIKRIEDIQRYKHDYVLDDMVKMFADDGYEPEIEYKDNDTLIQSWAGFFYREVGKVLLEQYPQDQAVYVGTILDEVVTRSIVSMEEAQDLQAFLLEYSENDKEAELYICRKFGITFYLLIEQNTPIKIDDSVRVLETINIQNLFKKEV
ncbi:DUF4004 family protein [Staphylococcus simulans]|uniref:DUF4004 family protein n=2 Tax=Staphylococcus TaxID=1279 RepID=A0ABP2YWT2_STASI|nr:MULTISPECIES: DUF4004 family protein [Staphylococcus]ERS94551.1 hypothetical protein SSIM_00225 [Staphylococcus simulans UMC-CNS-990]MCE5148029.1 DUF4004 family protein [Staphylococcus simulans]MDT4012234.1 DUF4004 family protein [Staphylococcus simulans]MDU0420663.1 DUF4004 family protein [Staphylococcus simulans]MDU0467399.1 DUF4004 family protein [Staphylococcus simulans]